MSLLFVLPVLQYLCTMDTMETNLFAYMCWQSHKKVFFVDKPLSLFFLNPLRTYWSSKKQDLNLLNSVNQNIENIVNQLHRMPFDYKLGNTTIFAWLIPFHFFLS